ncbi:MAG TPA: rhodanese-related sulfurtransferase [Bacteroidia bacterium]|nr:rhodanese-related sulfurtransferase [Bacteroidia bacterium]
MTLFNKYNKEFLKKKLQEESFNRITLSFYRYVRIDDPSTMRDTLYKAFDQLKVLGRIYIANEGINAQVTLPEKNKNAFQTLLNTFDEFKNMRLNTAVEFDNHSFIKLIVRTKKMIVADYLPEGTYDVSDVGQHLNAEEFNAAMESNSAIVIDMRNHYESEIGHFTKALKPDADTFRDAIMMATEMVQDKKDSKILLYCTGGIRCEKASAYFKHKGFSDVNQLHGGIITYAREIKEKNITSKFIGKNFVFDERMAEKITDDIISHCHQCDQPCDRHVNCANDDCHLLFIQCDECREKMNGCCTPECKDIAALPHEEQRKLRKGKVKKDAHAVYNSRIRPKLKGVRSS